MIERGSDNLLHLGPAEVVAYHLFNENYPVWLGLTALEECVCVNQHLYKKQKNNP